MLDQQVQQAQVLAEEPAGSGALSFEWRQCPSSMMNLNELDETNLLEMLQALTKRRDELRLIDKQLFDLMAECFVRLKPPAGPTSANSCSDSSSSGYGESNSSPASSLDDGAAMDLSRLAHQVSVGPAGSSPTASTNEQEAHAKSSGQQQTDDGANGNEQPQRASASKRSNLASPSLHYKKQRLLSAIISTDDIGEKQQVLAEKELDVRNDGRPSNSNQLEEQQQQQQQQSFKLIACNSSYQQPNHHQEEYHRQQQQQQLTHSQASLANSSPDSYPNRHRLQALQQHQFLSGPSSATIVSLQQQFDSGNTSSASDQDEDGHEQSGANERPQLKKFCSIGTAEMSFERFSREQLLIDTTLATLTHNQQQQQQQLCAPHLFVPIVSSSKQLVSNGDDNQLAHLQQRQQQPALLQPMMMMRSGSMQTLGQPGASSQPDLAHHLYDQFLHQCHAKSMAGTGASHEPNQAALVRQQEVASLSAPIYTFQQQQQQQQQQARKTAGAPSAFDRLIVSAKDLGPIVRKMSFRCHVCSSCFEDRHRLQQHLSIHLNLHPSWFEEKTIKETMAQYEMRRGDYLCQACQLRFETTAEFDKHMHLHGEKPHQCELCSQDNKFVAFRFFRQLLTHLRSHCFLYSCRFVPECRQTANRKDYLKLHILKHHLNNKLPEQYTICCH